MLRVCGWRAGGAIGSPQGLHVLAVADLADRLRDRVECPGHAAGQGGALLQEGCRVAAGLLPVDALQLPFDLLKAIAKGLGHVAPLAAGQVVDPRGEPLGRDHQLGRDGRTDLRHG